MNRDLQEKYEKRLERHKKAREELELEISQITTRMYLLYDYQQSILDGIGAVLLNLDQDFKLLKANKRAMETIFKNDQEIEKKDILSLLRHNNQILFPEDIEPLIDQDIEVSFLCSNGERRAMSAMFTSLKPINGNVEILLTMKDMQAIRVKDAEIKELQNSLIESAYKDGVTENAVSILHNIGNILTAILGKMSDTKLQNDISLLSSVLTKFSHGLDELKTPEQLGEFFKNNPKAQALPSLLRELAKTARQSETDLTEMMDDVRNKCSDISEVITTQQNYANFKENKMSNVNARQVVIDCISMNKEKITKRNIDLRIEDFPAIDIYINKIGFAQTVMNCLINAIESIDDRFNRDPSYHEKKITIRADEINGNFIIRIIDNGAGIDPEIRRNLFKFGFSTKKRSSGFGLHNCANFMISQQGKMEIESDGINTGATSILTCPIRKGG